MLSSVRSKIFYAVTKELFALYGVLALVGITSKVAEIVITLFLIDTVNARVAQYTLNLYAEWAFASGFSFHLRPLVERLDNAGALAEMQSSTTSFASSS